MSWGERSCYWYDRCNDPERECSQTMSNCNKQCEHYCTHTGRIKVTDGLPMIQHILPLGMGQRSLGEELELHKMSELMNTLGCNVHDTKYTRGVVGKHKCKDAKKKAKRKAARKARRRG